HHQTFATRDHWLVTSRGQVHDCQPTMSQGDARRAVGPYAGVIRATMTERCRHCLDRSKAPWIGGVRSKDDAGNPAHSVSSSPERRMFWNAQLPEPGTARWR